MCPGLMDNIEELAFGGDQLTAAREQRKIQMWTANSQDPSKA